MWLSLDDAQGAALPAPTRIELTREQLPHYFKDDGPHPLDGVDLTAVTKRSRRGTRGGCIDAGDARMRVGRIQHRAVALSRKIDIRDKSRAAGEETRVFAAPYGSADPRTFWHGGLSLIFVFV